MGYLWEVLSVLSFQKFSLTNFEQPFLHNHKSPFLKNIKFWYRYVDDILCLWTGTECQLNNFLNSLNTKIQYTMEIERDKKIT
jgi:hypothetical protein